VYIFSFHLYTVTTLPWKIQKKSFFNSIFIYTSDYLRYLRRKQTVIPSHLENVTALPCKMLNFFILTEDNVAFLQMLVALKRAGDGLALVALKRTGCDMWQLECQAGNVTAIVHTNHPLHGYTLPVIFATDHQLHRPPRCVEIQRMLQQSACATRPYRGLVLDRPTRALAACPRCCNLPRVEVRTVGWPHVRSDELGCLTAQKLDCVTSTMCWRIVLLEDKHVSSNAADR